METNKEPLEPQNNHSNKQVIQHLLDFPLDNDQEYQDSSVLESVPSLLEFLASDLEDSMKILAQNDTPYNRRNYIRVVFAFIEGLTFTLRNALLTSPIHELTDAEKFILLEKTFDIKENGAIKESSLKLHTVPNIKFTFKTASRVMGITNPLNTSDPNWQLLLNTLQVRHSLMHPKNPSALAVTGQQIREATNASLFFNKASITVMSQMIHQTKEDRRRMEAEIQVLKERYNELLKELEKK